MTLLWFTISNMKKQILFNRFWGDASESYREAVRRWVKDEADAVPPLSLVNILGAAPLKDLKPERLAHNTNAINGSYATSHATLVTTRSFGDLCFAIAFDSESENELAVQELIPIFVQCLDLYFHNVSEATICAKSNEIFALLDYMVFSSGQVMCTSPITIVRNAERRVKALGKA